MGSDSALEFYGLGLFFFFFLCRDTKKGELDLDLGMTFPTTGVVVC